MFSAWYIGSSPRLGERLFGDVILPECGLEEQIAGVGVVPQHLPNTGAAPGMAVAGGLALGVQLFHDGLDAHAGKVVGENTPHDLGLLGLYVVAVILLCPKTAGLGFTGFQHNVIHVNKVPALAFRGIDKPIKLPAGHLDPLDLLRPALWVFHPKISLVHCFLRFWHLW